MSNKSTDVLPSFFCCISQCRNYKKDDPKIDLYPLPEDSMQRVKCCEILGIPLEVGLSPTARVCSLHFKSKVGNYRPPPPSIPQATSTQPLTLMIDDGRRLNFKPILPRMQTTFPTPVQQPFTFQQPITLTFSPRLMTNTQQNMPPKELPNDANTDKGENIDDDSVEKDSSPGNSSDITLQLECEEDLLSTTQLNAYMKDLVEFCNASDLIRRLPPPEPIGSSSPLLISSNPDDEMPPLEPLFPTTATISSPVTLSSSIPNSQFVHIVSPSNKGISVASNSLLKNALSNLTKVETISSSALSSRSLFVNSPIITSRSVSTTMNDKIPAFISVNGKQLSNSSFGTTFSSNGLISQYGQIPTVATSNAAVNILSNVKLNSTVSGSSLRLQTVRPSPLSIASLYPNMSSLANSSPSSILPKNPSGIQSFQILPEKYKIVNAVSNNAAIPMMLLKALDSSDAGQSFQTTTSSASSSPLTILGREPDETEPCAASLCDVTLSEEPEQMFFPQEQNTYSNDNFVTLTQPNEDRSSSGKISVDDEAKLISAEGKQPSRTNMNTEIGPVIVDVISAKEGATEFFNTNTIPNILFDKSKKSEDSNDASATNQLDDSTKPSTDKVVYCSVDKMYSMCKDSIFTLQKFIPVIINGLQIFSEPIHMFKLKTPVPPKRIEEAENLRKRLRQENFIPWAVWWLVQRRYMPVVHPCNFCGSKKFVVDKNSNYPDGFCWTCANKVCPVQKPIRRPVFFERFKLYSIQDLLLLTYHWASQSSFEEIIQDVNLDCEKIWCYFKALQELCHQVATKKGKLGLAQSSMVEASAIKMGNVFILGAMDRRTRYVRLEALTETEAYQSSRHINVLEKWLNPSGTLITENKLPKDCLVTVRKLTTDPTVTDRYSSLPHTLNISKYLSKNMTSIFGSINQHSLKTNDIQGFLYELQWREKYGKFVDMSFWSILNHIRDQNVEEGSPVQVRKGSFSYDSSSLELNNALYARWGPNLEDYVEHSAVMIPLEPSYKLSGKDTKSYSKDTSSGGFSDYFHDIPEIQGGSAMVTSKSLLAVKIRFGETPADIDFYKSDAICLGLKLKNEGFINNPIKWLVRKSFVKNLSTCYVCQGVAFLKESSRFTDNCSWACQNEKCKFENVFRRPSFFARFQHYPMSHVAGMIFHWIVQSDESLINTDVPMDACKILDAWRSFQGLCSSALKRKKEKIGGEEHIVEVAVVKFGKLYILGAMDRKTKRSLLQAFPAEVGKFDILYYTLHSWILPESIIVVDSTKNFQMHRRYDGYNIILANTFVVDRHHPSCHVLNIKFYLIKHLSNMFCHIKPDFMRLEVMQSYLEELMWRERYGKEPQLAFSYIMNEIFYNDLRDKSEFQKRRDPEFIPIKFKELRVVLRRIPKSVLKFYGCEIPDSSKTSESIDTTFSETAEKETSSSVLDIADDIDSIPDAEQCSSRRLSESDDEVIFIDPDLPSSDIPEKMEIVLEQSPASEEQSPISGEQSPTFEEQSAISEPPSVSESTSSSTISDICTNKVQPLVIKMHKKHKKFRSYLKSELEKVKKLELEKSPSNSVSDIPNTVLRTNLDITKCGIMESPDIISSDSSHSNTWETKSTDSSKSDNKVARKRSAAHTSHQQNDERPICVECGEPVGRSYDHFVKQFKCTDCKKKSVYTTCCSKAFFEHRGSLLFGKRMPRRKKEAYGLHRPITLHSPWHCACGFNTKNGNKLASHMVNCRKRTCYYHQNVL